MASSSDNPTPTRQIQWPRFIIEGVVIVASILLALAADAWWDGYQNQLREQEYLQALLVEMQGVQAEFDEDQSERLIRLAGLDSVKTQFGGRTVEESRVVAWTLEGRRIGAFFPPSAVLQDLLSSGSLQLLRSDKLRYALLGYDQNAPRLRFLEDRERTFIDDDFRSYLIETLSLGTEQQPPGAVDAVLADFVFQNLVETRRFRLQRTLDYAEGVGSAIREVIESIEAELDAGT